MDLVKNLFKPNFFTTGLAMFAMFFGSGNLIFPVALGQMAGEQNVFAILGMFLTAVLLPFSTLCLMMLFNGDYDKFFAQIGIVPGKIIAFTILALIGPFGVLPRCIAFSYSTFSIYFDSISLVQYSTIACILVFLLSFKKSGVVGVIGNLLTPILLVSLSVIIYKGITSEHLPLSYEREKVSNLKMLLTGFLEGYKTFDIFAALFFATAIMPSLHNVLHHKGKDSRSLLSIAIASSVVGIVLLFSVYGGLSFVSANLRGGLQDIPGDKLLGYISTMTMGNTAGLIANVVVSLACLTTAISLAVVSSEFFRKEVFLEKVSYLNCLILTMSVSMVLSWLGFSGIMKIVLPVLIVICPAIITLIIMSGVNYAFGFKYIKVPVYTVFALSLAYTLFM